MVASGIKQSVAAEFLHSEILDAEDDDGLTTLVASQEASKASMTSLSEFSLAFALVRYLHRASQSDFGIQANN